MFESKEIIKDTNFLTSRNFSTISCMVNIFSFYFVWTVTIMVAMKRITALEIKYYMTESIVDNRM